MSLSFSGLNSGVYLRTKFGGWESFHAGSALTTVPTVKCDGLDV